MELHEAQELALLALRGLPFKLDSRPPIEDVPSELVPWLCWIADAGYCCLALFNGEGSRTELSAQLTDPSDYLIPVPILTVLRGYSVVDGLIVLATDSPVSYHPMLGLITPAEDTLY